MTWLGKSRFLTEHDWLSMKALWLGHASEYGFTTAYLSEMLQDHGVAWTASSLAHKMWPAEENRNKEEAR